MREQFLQRIISYINTHELISDGDVVFAGVSGGADSMCLLAVLMECRMHMDFILRVIHVEHGIRGDESKEDAAYVEQFCKARGIPCEVVCVDAAGFAGERHLSLEEAARELRYAAFAERAARVGHRRTRIAVAHHREDQAETVLWQMIRGSDVRGLGGMRPRRGRIIRPLLAMDRGEIEDYLRAEGIYWREDKTNGSADYTRNRIRGEVLPVLVGLNAQAARHLSETAGRLQETEDFLQEQTELMFEKYVSRQAGSVLLLEEGLADVHPLLVRRVVYTALCRSLGSAKDLGEVHVRLVAGLFSRQVGRALDLPCKGRAERVYEGVRLFGEACTRAQAVFIAEDGGKDAQGVFLAEEGAKNPKNPHFLPEQVQMEVLTQFDLAEISKKKYTKWFDYDKIKDNVLIRRRESGDYLVIDGEGHRQKLKRYLINEKIPERERDGLLLVADGSHIMWVIGHRTSDYYKVDKNTKKVLKVRFSGGKEDE